MSLYETIAVAEKYSVILDIGTAYTKIGFAREIGPRFIIPSEVKHPTTGQMVRLWHYKTEEELYILLKEFMHKVYFKHVVVNPKDRRVVIVESILCPIVFRETLAKVLFQHFEIPALLFVPSHLMVLFTLGVSSALVVDVGYNETVVLPIYEDVPILRAYQALPVGGQAIHRRIQAELMENATVKTTAGADPQLLGTVLSEPLSEAVLEDVKVRTCFVTRRARGLILQAHENRKRIKGTISPDPEQLEVPTPPPDVDYPLDGKKIMTIPGAIREWAAELLFEQDADNNSVATLILDALLECPIDARKTLANNIVLVGGTAMLPGFRHSLVTEIKMLLEDPRYSSRLPLKEIKIHNPPAKENYVAWLGAAIFAATEAVTSRSITSENYISKRYIPDWSDQNWLKLDRGL